MELAMHGFVGQTQTFTLSCPIPAYTRDKSEIAMVGFIQDEAKQERITG